MLKIILPNRKKEIILISFIFLTILSGCVPIMIQKEIQVKKDATGKIIETTEIERATQQGTTIQELQFDYLKIKQNDSKTPTVYSK